MCCLGAYFCGLHSLFSIVTICRLWPIEVLSERNPVKVSSVESLITTWHTARTEHWYFVFALCCHNNENHAPIPNLSSSAQLGGTPYHSPKLHPGPCGSVGMWRATDTVRQTHRHAWPLYILRHLQLTWNVTTTTDVANMDPEQYCLRDVYAYVHVARHTLHPRWSYCHWYVTA